MRLKQVVGVAFLVGCFAGGAQADIVTGFDDLGFWVGSGAQEAAVVIDFHDGATAQSFAWGYRWDGEASGADMLIAVAAADDNLELTYSGSGDDDFFLSAINYFDGVDAHVAAGYQDAGGVWYGAGYYLDGGLAGGAAVAGGGTALPADWTASFSGASKRSFGAPGRVLAEGAWDAWSFGAWGDTGHTAAPTSEVVAAIPEPGSVLLMGTGLGGMVWFRKRRAYFFRG